MSASGFGNQGAGGSPYGVGTPVDVGLLGGKLLRNQYNGGRSSGSRYLDPRTKDYVIDVNGRLLGMNDIQQMVLLAVSTDKGSSAVRFLGHELKKITRITDNFRKRVDATLRAAVLHLTTQNLIAVISVTTQPDGPHVFQRTSDLVPGRAFAVMRWRDLTDTGSGVNTERVTEVR